LLETIKHIHIYNEQCGSMPNVMAALPNTDGTLCSTPQGLADAHYYMPCSNAAKTRNPFWTVMVATKLDQSRVLVTKFRQNRLTLKVEVPVRDTQTDTHTHTGRQTHRQTRKVCNRAKNWQTNRRRWNHLPLSAMLRRRV